MISDVGDTVFPASKPFRRRGRTTTNKQEQTTTFVTSNGYDAGYAVTVMLKLYERFLF